MAEDRIEYDQHGNYRLVVSGCAGRWVEPQKIARVTADGESYLAFSEFWKGVYPTHTVFALIETLPVRQVVV